MKSVFVPGLISLALSFTSQATHAEKVRYVECLAPGNFWVVSVDTEIWNTWESCHYISTKRALRIIRADRQRVSKETDAMINAALKEFANPETRRRLQQKWEEDCASDPNQCPLGFSKGN